MNTASAFDLESGVKRYSTPGIGGGFVQQVGPLVGPDGTVYMYQTADYVNIDGEIDLQIRHTVLRPFLAYTFESFIDQVEILVE